MGKMKKKRRTLKNRGYAETTRRKKEEEIKKLEAELKDLENERRDMQQERMEKEMIHQKLANSNRIRLDWARRFNIPIPGGISVKNQILDILRYFLYQKISSSR